jgi:hypothetical protein
MQASIERIFQQIGGTDLLIATRALSKGSIF